MAIQKIQNLHICHPFDMVTPNNEAMKFHFGFYVLINVHMFLIMPDEFPITIKVIIKSTKYFLKLINLILEINVNRFKNKYQLFVPY